MSPSNDPTIRCTLVRATVANLIEVHDAWQADPNSPDVPTEAFEGAVNEMRAIVEFGDVPEAVRGLVRSAERFLVEWGEFVQNPTLNGQPRGSFWAAFRGLVDAGQEDARPKGSMLEPVHVLLAQAKDDPRRYEYVARAYGARKPLDDDGRKFLWVGPFFDVRGVPNLAAIEAHAKWEQDPDGKGSRSMIPEGWVHPADQHRVDEHEAAVKRRLAAIKARQDAAGGDIDPATVEELILEGQYVDVIAKAKGITVEEVEAEAEKLGLTINVRPNLAAVLAPTEPKLPDYVPVVTEKDEAEDEAEEPFSELEVDQDDDDEPEELDEDAAAELELVDELIADLSAKGELGAAEIKAEVKDKLGVDIDISYVGESLAKNEE